MTRAGTAHRITATGNHAQPMSEARRQHIHGPLQTEAEPIRCGVILWPIAIGLAFALAGVWL